MEFLLSVLRSEPLTAPDVPWHETILLAEEEQVLPLFLQKLTRDEIPEETRGLLDHKRRELAIASFLMSSTLASLLRSFAQANIPAMPIKGPFLAERLYGGTLHRSSKDLDVLVQVKDLKAAETLLATEGFERISVIEEHSSQWLRGTVMVELHDALANPREFPFHLDGVWEHATLSSFQGQPAWLMSPHHELLYLCLHGVRHKFERLCYCADVAMAIRSRAHAIPAESLDLRGREGNAVALLGCLIAKKFDVALMQDIPLGTTDQQRVWMAKRADDLWQTLLTKSAAKPTGADWSAFYTQLEARPLHRTTRRCLHWIYTSTRLIDDDLKFAEQFKLRKRWQAFLLRPLRLLKRKHDAGKTPAAGCEPL